MEKAFYRLYNQKKGKKLLCGFLKKLFVRKKNLSEEWKGVWINRCIILSNTLFLSGNPLESVFPITTPTTFWKKKQLLIFSLLNYIVGFHKPSHDLRLILQSHRMCDVHVQVWYWHTVLHCNVLNFVSIKKTTR